MNPAQIFTATLSCVLFGLIAVYGGAGTAHEMRVGGLVEDLQQYSVIGMAGLAGFAAQFLPLVKNLFPPAGKGGAGKAAGWLAWFMQGGGTFGFIGQIIGLIEAAASDKDHRPNYFEGKIYWDDGTMTPLVIGTPAGVKPAPAPAVVPQPQPAPAPAVKA